MSDKKENTTIHLKNSYFESLIIVDKDNKNIMFSPSFQSLLRKRVFPGEFKPGYWLGRAFDKIIQEMNAYMKEKQKLIQEHTKKYEKDGEVKTPKSLPAKGGQISNQQSAIRNVKEGDPIFLDNGQPDWIDFEVYLKEFNELQEIEIDLGIWPIVFDPEKGPDAIGQEMLLLIPLLKEPSEESSGKVVPFKKK